MLRALLDRGTMRGTTILKTALPIAGIAIGLSGTVSIPWAIAIAGVSLCIFVWGCFDFLEGIRIVKLQGRVDSANSQAFDRQSKRLLVIIIAFLFLVASLSVSGVYWYRTEANQAKKRLNAEVEQLRGTMQQEIDRLRQSIQYVKSWGVTPPNLANLTLDGDLLEYYSRTHRVMIACRWPDPKIEPLDDTRFDKSRAFEIRNGDIPIRLILDKAKTRPFTCTPALLPNGMTPEEVTNLRQVRDRGGIILQSVTLATGETVQKKTKTR